MIDQPTATAEQMAMARRIAADTYANARDHDYAQLVREGLKDDTMGVEIALLAIQETTEMAAAFLRYEASLNVEDGEIFCLSASADALDRAAHLRSPNP